ncbi:MAG: 30S ribosomal protein S20 [Deltaproteobacteria bacterium]|nr:30S ribosomal protein S20 [Deltaproteobacteria bacterium]
MAQHKSAEKRHRQSLKKRANNVTIRSKMRNAIKVARTSIESKAPDKEARVKAAVAAINRAASKHVVKRETASRYVGRLMTAAAK